MALYSGVTGKIKIGEKDILHATGFNVDISKDIHEIVSFGSEYKEKLAGVKDWSGGLDGAADFATSAGQKDLFDAFESGEIVECIFYLNAGTFFSGTALIESLGVTHAADGTAEVSISLAGSDAVSLTVPGTPEPDYTLKDIILTSVAGTGSGDTKVTANPAAPAAGNKYVYKLGTNFTAVTYGQSVANWLEFTSGADIATSTNTKITVCEATAGNLAVGRGIVIIVKK